MSQFVPDWYTETTPSTGTGISLRLGKKLHEEQTEFQKLEVYDTDTYGKLMVLDDCIMVTDLDNFIYHEMMAHPVLYSHPNPANVVIIGGGDCGTLTEVLRHPEVKQATQIDIDERVTRVSEMYFPQLTACQSDPRATLLFEDGIKWIREAAPGSIDVIIVDSTDPVGPGEVLFTREFYQYCFKALGEHGLLVQQSESPLLHAQSVIKKMSALLRDTGMQDIQTLNFPMSTYPTGWWSATIAAKSGALTFARESDANAIGDSLQYYTAAMHQAAFTLPPYLKRQLAE